MTTLAQIVSAAEYAAIATTLEAHAGNVTHAARALGLERTHLHKKMRQHGLLGHGRAPAAPWEEVVLTGGSDV